LELMTKIITGSLLKPSRQLKKERGKGIFHITRKRKVQPGYRFIRKDKVR